MGYMDRSRIFRIFDPLHLPKIKSSDCVLHISSFLQEKDFDDGRREGQVTNKHGKSWRDFISLKKNIENLSNQIVSNKEGFRLDLVISINGHVETQEYIEYLKEINNTIIGKNKNIYITIFQRPNVGFQWGGFYDVWSKYKFIDCNWYVTLEADVYFDHDLWFDYCIDKIKDHNNVGYLGQADKINTIDPCYYNGPISKEVWRDKNNKILEYPDRNITEHTRGGMYFCKKNLLHELEIIYGCFTHSMGCNYYLDGIILGEVGFAHKVRALGYDLYCDENIVRVRDYDGI